MKHFTPVKNHHSSLWRYSINFQLKYVTPDILGLILKDNGKQADLLY